MGAPLGCSLAVLRGVTPGALQAVFFWCSAAGRREPDLSAPSAEQRGVLPLPQCDRVGAGR